MYTHRERYVYIYIYIYLKTITYIYIYIYILEAVPALDPLAQSEKDAAGRGEQEDGDS